MHSYKKKVNKRDIFIQSEFGYDDIDELAESGNSIDTGLGICMNSGCNELNPCEPDNDSAFCESCKTNTVKGFENLVLETVC